MDRSSKLALIERDVFAANGKTLVESAYAALRREILDGGFAPGVKLRTR